MGAGAQGKMRPHFFKDGQKWRRMIEFKRLISGFFSEMYEKVKLRQTCIDKPLRGRYNKIRGVMRYHDVY